MRKIYFTLPLFFVAHTVFSQGDSLLKKFKYRIDRYQAINYGINGATNYYRSEFGTGTHTNSSSAGAFGINYYTVRSTDRILLTASGGFYTSYNRAKSVNSTEGDKSRNFAVLPSVYILNKWFAKSMFTELGADISSNLNFSRNTLANQSGPLKNKQTGYSLVVRTGIGKGRLENVTDMQNALWLYKELNEAKIISRQLSGDELIELGRAITRGNNTRVLDARRRTQFILRTVDDYFQQKQLISKTDIDYFVRLNDILFFAINNPRLSGTEKFLRLTPGVSGGSRDDNQNTTVDKYEQRYDTRSLFLTSGLNKYKPLNLTHQQNYGAFVKLGYISKRLTERDIDTGIVINESHRNADLKQAGLDLFFEHGFYPNTRTFIIFNLHSEGGYQDLAHESNFYGTVGLSGTFNYFISYRTRLNCNLGIAYQKNMYYNDIMYYNSLPDVFQLNANLSLDISL